MEELYTKVILIQEFLLKRYKQEGLIELQPQDRRELYKCAMQSEIGNKIFLPWLEIVVCQKFVHYLDETNPYCAFSDLLVNLELYISTKHPTHTLHGYEALQGTVTNGIPEHYWNVNHYLNGQMISYCIARTSKTVKLGFEKANFLPLETNLSNSQLDVSIADVSVIPVLFNGNRHVNQEQYWLWWLEEAIPQALEKCKDTKS